MTSFIESIFGPHAEFIVASYAAVILLIGGLSLAIIADHRRQARLIAERDPRAREPESTSQS
jgi:heme exporter protein D